MIKLEQKYTKNNRNNNNSLTMIKFNLLKFSITISSNF